MTTRHAGLIASVASLLALVGCASAVQSVTIETRITPWVDTPTFHRVLIAGFLTDGSASDLDVNAETVRLLRSQFRSRTPLKVVGSADSLPPIEVAAPLPTDHERLKLASELDSWRARVHDGHTERDFAVAEPIFVDATFWKRLGEEFLNPLIVTGTVRFVSETRNGFVQDNREVFDDIGRRHVGADRRYVRTAGYRLDAAFVLIDSETGAVLQSLAFREELFHELDRPVPALAAYFELMDRILPALLARARVTDQTVRVSRILLQ